MPIAKSIRQESIALVGMPGSGKTTIGKPLAKKLGLPFYDLDNVIKKDHGQSPADILREHGEPAFRAIELITTRQALQTPCVLATGGGAFVQSDTRDVLQQQAITLWLDIPLPILQQRLAKEPGDRPLSAFPESLVAMYAERQPYYALASHRITITAADTVKSTVNRCYEAATASISHS